MNHKQNNLAWIILVPLLSLEHGGLCGDSDMEHAAVSSQSAGRILSMINESVLRRR